jgi:uncharacterized protein YggE
MKWYLKLFIVAILVLFVTAGNFESGRGHAKTLSQPVAQQTESETRKVQVTGVGEIQVEPDSAVISLGVQTEASSAQAALNQNNTKMQALLETLEEADISSEDIQTQTLHLGPRFEFDNDTRTLVGYVATNIVEVRIDDLDMLGTLIDEAVNDGANTVENIRFEISNPENMTDQARQTAFQNARHKAEELADLSDASLGPILEIQETSSAPGPILRSAEITADAAAVPISPGSQTVSVEIQVTWTLLISNEQ